MCMVDKPDGRSADRVLRSDAHGVSPTPTLESSDEHMDVQ